MLEKPPFREVIELKLSSLVGLANRIVALVAGKVGAVLSRGKMESSRELSSEFVAEILATINKVGAHNFFEPLKLSIESGAELVRFLEKIERNQIVLKDRQIRDHEPVRPNPHSDGYKLYLADIYEDLSEGGEKCMGSNWNVDTLSPATLFIYALKKKQEFHWSLDLSLFFTDNPIMDVSDLEALGNLHLEKSDAEDYKRELWVSQDGKTIRVTTRHRVPTVGILTEQTNYHLLPVRVEGVGTKLVKYIYAADNTKDKKTVVPIEARDELPLLPPSLVLNGDEIGRTMMAVQKRMVKYDEVRSMRSDSIT